MKNGALALLLMALPGAAMAAANQCTLPNVTPAPRAYNATAEDPAKDWRSTVYVLAVTWAPQYCVNAEGMGGTFNRDFECESGNRFGFVLHGLWPDGDGKNWPQYCRPAEILKPSVIRANLCMTPSADLLQHEWAKHGTCEWKTPERYFADARAIYEKLRFPDMEALAKRDDLTSGTFTKAFVAANRGRFSADMMRVWLSKDGSLREVHLCLNARRRFMRCVDRPDRDDRPVRIRPIG